LLKQEGAVGVPVGDVGASVGAPVGGVGDEVGRADGTEVGPSDGALVGGVGALVGARKLVGADVVGAFVGRADGTPVGSSVGVPVGALVGALLGGRGQQSVELKGGALNGAGQAHCPNTLLQITREQQSFGQSIGEGVGKADGCRVGTPVGAFVGQQLLTSANPIAGPKHVQLPMILLHIPFPQQF
jgi:hypothetical protein